MSAQVAKFGCMVFAALCCAMLCNMFLLQPQGGKGRQLSVEPGISLAMSATAQRRAAKEKSGVGSDPQLVMLNGADEVETTRAIQRELTGLGYAPGPADGAAGIMTRAAIMAFEFDNGLSVAGRADPDLLKVLLFGIPPQLSAPNAKAGTIVGEEAKRVVSSVQRTLLKLGYHVGDASGELGPATERAIRDFESDQDMRETGRISGRLVARLAQLADGGRVAMSQ